MLPVHIFGYPADTPAFEGFGLPPLEAMARGMLEVMPRLGHVKIVPGGHFCGCGQEGCWEAYSSGTALARFASSLVTADPEGSRRLLEVADGAPLSGAHVTAHCSASLCTMASQ